MSYSNTDVAYLWLVDGIPTAFSNDERVDLTYVQSLGEHHTAVHYGLDLPSSLTDQLDLATGMLADTSATFSIADVDGSLAALFGSSFGSAIDLPSMIKPGDTGPALAFGQHAGVELFGPAGERRRCSCVPGFNVGLLHYSSAQSFAFGLGGTKVTSAPRTWAGRRCALYRLTLSSSGDWPDLTDEAAALRARVWWGSMLAQGDQGARVWSFKCSGRESWAMGNLGVGAPKEPLPVQALVSLDPEQGETMMRASLKTVYLYDLNIAAETTFVLQTTDSSSLIGAQTYAQVAAIFDAWLASVAAIGGGASFDSQGSSGLGFSTTPGDDGVWIRYDRSQDAGWLGGPWTVARVSITAHEKVWKILGYEPAVQNEARDPVDDFDQYGKFSRSPEWLPGRWDAQFYSASPIAMQAFEQGDDFYEVADTEFFSGGYARRWPPIYPGGAQVIDMDRAGQEIRLATLDPVFLLGSNVVPLPADPDDVTSPLALGGSIGDVTTTGLLIVDGPYRREGDEDTAKAPAGYAFGLEKERVDGRTTQVARVAWRESPDGSIAVDSDSFPRVVVVAWLSPRLYGIGFEQLTGQWSSWISAPENGIETKGRALLALEHSRDGDSLPLVVAQLLASTGTAGGWYTDGTLTTPAYGLGGSPVLDVGANDPGLDGVGVESFGSRVDQLPAQLSRGVPSQLLALGDSQGSLEQAIADYLADPLFYCKATMVRASSSRATLGELLAPTGLCMSLAGGRYGLFDPWTFRAPTSTGTVTSETYRGKPGSPADSIPAQTLRKLSPVDLLAVSSTRDPATGDFERSINVVSTDGAASSRAQTITRQITGAHLVHRLSKARGSDWPSSFAPRWDRGFAFWAAQHFEIEFECAADDAHEFEVGSIISVTDQWVVNPVGVYGITASPGFVTGRKLSPATEIATVTALVSVDSMRMFASAAMLVRYDDNEDGLGHRLFVRDDFLGFRGGLSFDAEGFVEPAWSTVGGDALIEGWTSRDGVTWSRGIFGQVASIDTTTPGSTWIQLTGALTGAPVLRDHWTVFVLRNVEDQTAAWPFEIFAPICAKDGTAGGTLGVRWQG